MKRLLPYLIFVLITGGLLAFVYKDRIFPPAPGTETAGAGQRGQGGRSGGGGGFRRGEQIVPIVATKAKTDNVPVYLNGVGTVQAFNTATVRAQVSGRLTEVNFREGQDVKAGDILAKIDPVLFQAAYDQAVAKKAQDEALLANTRLDEKRYAGLASSNYSSQQQADTTRSLVQQYEAQVKQDQALIDNARANLNYATVRAPIEGRTGLRLVDMGNLVSASDATGIVVITQLRPISILFTLPENTVPEVLDAQTKGTVPLQALTGAGVLGDGNLLVVDNQIDQTTGTVKIKGVFPNEQNRLWPGQFVNVKLKLKTLENAIVVPSVAIQQGANGSYVYVVTPENTAKITYVKVVQEGESQSVIGQGVAVGDVVVTSGFASLQDGAKVKVDFAPEKGETPAATGAPSGGPASPAENSAEPQRKKRRPQSSAADASPDQDHQGGRRKKSEQSAEPTAAASVSADQSPPKQ